MSFVVLFAVFQIFKNRGSILAGIERCAGPGRRSQEPNDGGTGENATPPALYRTRSMGAVGYFTTEPLTPLDHWAEGSTERSGDTFAPCSAFRAMFHILQPVVEVALPYVPCHFLLRGHDAVNVCPLNLLPLKRVGIPVGRTMEIG